MTRNPGPALRWRRWRHLALIVWLIPLLASILALSTDAGATSPGRLTAQDDEEELDEDEDPDALPTQTESEKRFFEALGKYSAPPRGPGPHDDFHLDCEELFQAIIDDFPRTEEAIDALYYRSECQRKMRRPEDARAGFLEFLQWRSEGNHVADALHYLGHCYQSLRDWEGSLPVFARVYEELDEGPVPACMYDAGISLRELGRYDEARKLWERLIRDHSTHPYAEKARTRMKTLKPPRERLKPLVETYLGYIQELKRPKRDKKEIHKDLKAVLTEFGEVRAPETEKFLLDQFKKQHGQVQAAIVAPLIEVGGKRSAKLLLGGLAKLGDRTQREVLVGLGPSQVEGISLSRVLGHLVKPGAKPTLQQAAVGFLGRIRHEEAVRLLVGVIHPGEPSSLNKASLRTNQRVMGALRGVRDKRALRYLSKDVMGNSRTAAPVRCLVAEALGFTRSMEVLPALIEALGDPAPGLAVAAVGSIGRLGAEEAVPAIVVQLERRRRDREFTLAALRALSRLDATPAIENLLALAEMGDPEVRTLSVNSLARFADIEACFQRLLAALEDPAWQVRRAALDALAKVRRKEMVDVLIRRLGKEDGPNLILVVKRLIDLTGVDLGPKAPPWEEWWKLARLDWDAQELARGGKKKEGKTFVRRAKVDIDAPSYFGVEIISRRLAFIIDVSGSMSGMVNVESEGGDAESVRKIDLAREELLRAVDGLRPGTRFNLVRFDTNYTALWPKITRLNTKSAKAAKRFAQGLQPAGGTNIYDSLAFVIEKSGCDTIFLLSDGAPSAGQYTDPGQILEEVRRLNESKKLTIHTIALGYESGFMKDLAEQNGGEYVVAGRNSSK